MRVLLVAVASWFLCGRMSAQQSDTSRATSRIPFALAPTYKDPELATLLSFMMPGAGQLYAKPRLRGVAELAIAIVGVAIATGRKASSEDALSRRELGFMLAGASWMVGIATAADDARAYNRAADKRR